MTRDYFDQIQHEADQHELAEKIERNERMAVAPESPRCLSVSDVAKLIDALRFYADPDTYHAIVILADRPCGEFAHDLDEKHNGDYDRAMPGALARQVLRDVGVDWC